jgi:hypothetical protein
LSKASEPLDQRRCRGWRAASVASLVVGIISVLIGVRLLFWTKCGVRVPHVALCDVHGGVGHEPFGLPSRARVPAIPIGRVVHRSGVVSSVAPFPQYEVGASFGDIITEGVKDMTDGIQLPGTRSRCISNWRRQRASGLPLANRRGPKVDPEAVEATRSHKRIAELDESSPRRNR